MNNDWDFEHRTLKDNLDVEFNVRIYFVAPKTAVDGISIEMYELDGDTVSREDLVDRFGNEAIETFEVDLAVG
jgi:hypothetical protein